jgi:hypothetical protein
VATRAVSEKPYELAYEASVRAIEDQAKLLDGIHARAGKLLAAAAGGVVFFRCTALLPHGFRFSLDGVKMLEIVQRRALLDPVGAIEALRARRAAALMAVRDEPRTAPCPFVASPRGYRVSRRRSGAVDHLLERNKP